MQQILQPTHALLQTHPLILAPLYHAPHDLTEVVIQLLPITPLLPPPQQIQHHLPTQSHIPLKTFPLTTEVPFLLLLMLAHRFFRVELEIG